MRRAPKLILMVGSFLVVSVLWPFDQTTDFDDFASGAVQVAFSMPFMDAPSYIDAPDLWNGETVHTVFDEELTVLPDTPTPIPMPPGERIYPGTEKLRLLHTITNPAGAPSSLYISFTGANDAGWTVPIAGDRTEILITEAMNDWSPDPDSRWHFSLQSDSVQYVKIRLNIVRNDDQFPTTLEYQDYWDKARVLTIFNQQGDLFDARVTPSNRESATDAVLGGPVIGSTPADVPGLGHIPPFDVDELRVTFVYNSSSPTSMHYRPSLSFRGADLDDPSWEYQAMPPTKQRVGANGVIQWSIPIDPEMWDSPFAEHTRWDVSVNWRGDPTGLPVYMDGDYHFWMDVLRAPGT